MSETSETLAIDVQARAEGLLVSLRGELNVRTAVELRGALLERTGDSPQQIVMDLSGLTGIDSSGIGLLVELKRRIERRGGRITLRGTSPRIRRVLEMSRLDAFFEMDA
jgi:anti-sigma B factor antagonist